MDKTVYLNQLYDFYKDLLTVKQTNYFERYYFDNLSLSEISEEYGISRNAISKQLDIVEKKLVFYEKSLNLLNKKNKILELVGDNDLLYDKVNEIL